MSKGVLASEMLLRSKIAEKLRPPGWIGGEKLLQLVTCIASFGDLSEHRHHKLPGHVGVS